MNVPKQPNPCVECNKYFKFQAFYEQAKKLNCDYIATGHYAKIQWSEEYKQYVLTKSKADKKRFKPTFYILFHKIY